MSQETTQTDTTSAGIYSSSDTSSTSSILGSLDSDKKTTPSISETGKQDLSDKSYVDPRLTIIEEAKLIGIKKPGTLIILHPPKTGLSSLDFLLKVLNRHKKQALEHIAAGRSYFIAGAENFPKMIRDIIPDKKTDKGQIISPSKIDEGWIGGIACAVNEDFAESLGYYKENGYEVITGHMPHGLHAYKEGTAFLDPVSYAAVVNDPIKRMVSLLKFDAQRGYLDGLKTEEEIYQYLLTINIDNAQTRMVAGLEHMHGPCTEKTLEAAKANIEKNFSLVGVSDDLEGFTQAIAAMYGIGPLAIGKKQVTGEDLMIGGKKVSVDNLPPHIKAKLIEQNRFDMALYEWCKKRWYQFKSAHVVVKTMQEEKETTGQKVLSVFVDANPHRTKETFCEPIYMSKDEIKGYNKAVEEGTQIPVNEKEFTSIPTLQKIIGSDVQQKMLAATKAPDVQQKTEITLALPQLTTSSLLVSP